MIPEPAPGTETEAAARVLVARANQQGVVAELGRQALSGIDLPALMDETVARVAQCLDVEYATVLEVLPDGKALLVRAGIGWRVGLTGQATVAAGTESQAGYTLLASETVVVEDLRTEKRFSGPLLLHNHGVISGVSVIIPGREQPFGVLGAYTTRRQTFTRDDDHAPTSKSSSIRCIQYTSHPALHSKNATRSSGNLSNTPPHTRGTNAGVQFMEGREHGSGESYQIGW